MKTDKFADIKNNTEEWCANFFNAWLKKESESEAHSHTPSSNGCLPAHNTSRVGKEKG
jgi:hypothetical protein